MPHVRNSPDRRTFAAWRWMATLSAATLLLASCSSLPVEKFTGDQPTLDPIRFFTGKTHSWGVFENRAGEPARRFRTTCQGRLENGVLLLDQDFAYDDGHHQQRHWRIRRMDGHRFAATANGVVGTATGTAYGNAFRWEYTVALKSGNPFFNVRLKQWMYLQEGGGTLLNRGTVRALGIEVAQITEQFRRD